MLPNTENVDDLVLDFNFSEQNNTQTFNINKIENIMGGKLDDLKALEQTIYFLLNIEADKYPIYPYTFGVTTVDLIGKPPYYVMAILPERVKEALLSDDRILDVSNFEFEVDKNKIHATFVVSTIYGEVNSETVVIV